MNCKRLLAMLVLLLFAFNMQVLAQEKVVTGKVTDAKDGSPLGNVSIQVKGGKGATQTGPDGSFKIKVTGGNPVLVLTSVGYAKQELAANDEVINVSLVQANVALSEVVVVAYGTRKKSDLTGAVTSVSAKDFQKGNIASSEQLLQGKVAGLQITSGGGSAGGGSSIRIRGGASITATNEPLIVIDGVPVDGNGLGGASNILSTINPNDIESMSVLKDASATALYGSRASNGVIIVTTKKGSKGKVKFNYNALGSVGKITKRVNVFSGDEVRSIINASGDSAFIKQLGTSNTDWQKEIYQNSVGFDNNISASGMAYNIPFRVSLGYYNQKGNLKTNTFDRLSYAINLSPKFFKDALSVNFNAKYAHTNNRIADEGAIGSAVSFDPTQSIRATNKFGGYYEWLQPNGNPVELSTRNPLALLDLKNNTQKVDRVITNLQLDYKLPFLPDLHVQVNAGLDQAYNQGKTIIDSTSATNYKTAGYKKKNEALKLNQLLDVSLFYQKDLKSIDSKIDVLVLHSYQSVYNKEYNFAVYSQYQDSLLTGTIPTFATSPTEYRMESYLGRINYTLANKYILSASLRSDASSKFAKSNRIGYFPSLAAAWKLKDEFLKNINQVTDLKLRIGWGKTGQQDLGGDYYSYLSRYTASTASAQYQFGSDFYSFYRPTAYNSNLQWENTATTNFGIDFGFFNNRISGSLDVYNRKTNKLLLFNPTASGANFDVKMNANVGNVDGSGFEFVLNTNPYRTKDWNINFGFNVAYNKVTAINILSNPDPDYKGIQVSGLPIGTGNNIGMIAVGQTPFVYFVKKQVYDAKTGLPIEGLYEDINRDGVVDDNDRVFYKKPAHDVLLGFSTDVSYKKWTLGLTGHGSFGGYLYNAVNATRGVLSSVKTPSGTIGNGVSNYYATNFFTNAPLSDYYLENASFFRLDNINLGYNAGKVFNNKANLRVTANVQNVLVITKYSGLDPEVSSTSGIDNNIYPRPRMVSVGVNLDF